MFLAGKSPNIRSYMVHKCKRFWPTLGIRVKDALSQGWMGGKGKGVGYRIRVDGCVCVWPCFFP